MALPAVQSRFHIVHRRLEDCDWEFTCEQVASFCLARRMRSRWRTPVIKDAPVELRPSPVHGRGVFATRDIAAGEPVTVYPCHDILWRPESGLNWSVAEPDCWPNPDYGLGADIFGGTVSVVGDPTLTSDPRYLGHMINDGARATGPDGAEVYKTVSRQRRNVAAVWIDGIETPKALHEGFDYNLYIESRRDIKKDEELFMAYGAMYWLEPRPVAAELAQETPDGYVLRFLQP